MWYSEGGRRVTLPLDEASTSPFLSSLSSQLIDAEEDRTRRAVLVGMLLETERR